MDEGIWKMIRTTREAIGISHLFFADDVLIFRQANKEQMHLIANTLKDFCEVSGMKVNLDKSRMFCSTTVDERLQGELSGILGIARASNLGKYLGLPLLKGWVKRENFPQLLIRLIRGWHLGSRNF